MISVPKMLRLVVVDDDARTRGAMAAYLATRKGITVIAEAADGQEAINLIPVQVPDVILMDVRMPRLDGLHAARILKDRWPRTKVIILSMYPSYRADAEEIGADAFLVKGGTTEDLVSTIRAVAGGSSADRSGNSHAVRADACQKRHDNDQDSPSEDEGVQRARLDPLDLHDDPDDGDDAGRE